MQAIKEHYEKGKKQNILTDSHIQKIVSTYQYRKEEDRYSRRVSLEEIQKNDYNLNITRYISTAIAEKAIDLNAVHGELSTIEENIQKATAKHNEFLKELGLMELQ